MDFDETNDPDFRAAISASLRDTHGSEGSPSSGSQRPKQDVVDLTGESDDERGQTFPKSRSVVSSDTEESDEDDDGLDLRRAIDLSMQSFREEVDLTEVPDTSEKGRKDPEPGSLSSCSSVENKDAPPPMGLLGLNRKQMEEERLSRLAKRKAQDASLDEPDSKHARTGALPQRKFYNETTAAPGLRSSPSTSHAPGGKAMQQRVPSNQPGIQFPEGIVKKTWAFGCPRAGDDIKIEEVFQQSDLELAVLSSFMWDTDWLFSKMNISKTRLLLIMQAKEEYIKRENEANTVNMPTVRLCFPPMDGQVNCMHSKLLLLFHNGYVRIVVPTANLVPFDWGEQGGFMENTVFLIDLPKKDDQGPAETPKTLFYEDLVYFLGASTVHENIVAKLDSFDFSKTAHLAFVHSIGGSHTDDAWRRTGHCGLGRAVNSLGLRSSDSLNIDFVTSSVGSLTNEFMRSMYLAAQGDDGLTEYILRTAKSFPAKNPSHLQLVEKTTAAEWKDRFRVYFPSESTVRESKGGPHNAGTICFQEKWFQGEKFPRPVLRDCRSKRPNLLMHNKIMYVRPDQPIRMSDGSSCRAWAYVGSANLSESAWGRLVQDRTTKQPKLNCRNWECGVLVPVISQGEEKGFSEDSSVNDRVVEETGSNSMAGESLDIFEGTVPVPFQVPGRRFGAGLKPWYFGF